MSLFFGDENGIIDNCELKMSDEEEIVLLDDSGCPADPVFPGLTKEPGTGALLGRFEAFKFSETTVVNFEVNVQFCQDQCNPVSIR